MTRAAQIRRQRRVAAEMQGIAKALFGMQEQGLPR
jgi:hypothetical protein